MAISWRQISYYCLISDCGKYTITKGDVAGIIVYAAYHGRKPIGEVSGSAGIAQRYCEVHAEKTGEEEQ